MAASFTCDGCGNQVDVPTVLGHVIKRDYCEGCATLAEKFLALEEALRNETREKFMAKRATLIGDLYKLKGVAQSFKLPDVP